MAITPRAEETPISLSWIKSIVVTDTKTTMTIEAQGVSFDLTFYPSEFSNYVDVTDEQAQLVVIKKINEYLNSYKTDQAKQNTYLNTMKFFQSKIS
jgi:hypothetical protein